MNDSPELDYAAYRSDIGDPLSSLRPPPPPSNSVRLDEVERGMGRVQIGEPAKAASWYVYERPPVESGAAAWKRSCRFYQACPRPRAMPPCKGDAHAPSWEALSGHASELAGSTVSVTAQIDLQPIPCQAAILIVCRPGVCCHSSRQAAMLDNRGEAGVLEAWDHALALPGYECTGDESKGCCNVTADGRAVIATGRLARNPLGSAGACGAPLWQLENAHLCTLAPPLRR